MNRPIDPVDIKTAIRDGQLEVFVANGNVYIKDTETGDCVKIWGGYQLLGLPPSPSRPIVTDTDTISRQDTIEHLKKRLYESALNNDGIASYTFEEIADNRIQIWMDELPPSPSRPKGKWIPQNLNKSDGMISTAVYYYPKCSVCGASANYTNFCPNCGARMEDSEE